MKRLLRILVLTLILLLVIAMPILAYYTSTITLTNSGSTDYPQIGILANLDVTGMVDTHYITTDGFDTRIKDGSTELKHMLADDKVAFVADIPSNTTKQFTLTTANTALTYYPIIIGSNGYITTDHGIDFTDAIGFETQTTLDSTSDAILAWQGSNFEASVNGTTVSAQANVSSTQAGNLYDLYEAQGSELYTTISDSDHMIAELFTTPDVAGLVLNSATIGIERSGTASGNVICEIQQVENNNPNGVVMASAMDLASAVQNNSIGFTFDSLSGGDGLSPNTTYALVFYSESTSMDVYYYNGSEYTGDAFTTTNAGSSWSSLGVISDFVSELNFTESSESQLSVSSDFGTDECKIGVYVGTVAGTSELLLYKDDGLVDSQSLQDYETTIDNSAWSFLNNVPYANYFRFVSDGGGVVVKNNSQPQYYASLGVPNISHNIINSVYGDYSWETESEYQPNTIIQGNTLPDLVGDNPGTITWGTNVGDFNVSVSPLISSGSINVPSKIQHDNIPALNPNMTGIEETPTGNILYEPAQVVSQLTDFPIWILFTALGMVFVVVTIIIVMKVTQNQLMAGAAGLVMTFAGYKMQIFDWWMFFVILVMFIAILVMERKTQF